MKAVTVQDDAAEAEWFSVTKLPSYLAFDHKLIVRKAFEHLLKAEETSKTGKTRPLSSPPHLALTIPLHKSDS